MEEGETGAACSKYGRYQKFYKTVKKNEEKTVFVWIQGRLEDDNKRDLKSKDARI